MHNILSPVSCVSFSVLLSQVPGFLRAQTMQQVDALARGMLKQGQQRAAGADKPQTDVELPGHKHEQGEARQSAKSAPGDAKSAAGGLSLLSALNPGAPAQPNQASNLSNEAAGNQGSQPGPSVAHQPTPTATAGQGGPAITPEAGHASPTVPPTLHEAAAHGVQVAGVHRQQTLQAAASHLAEIVTSAAAAHDDARTTSSGVAASQAEQSCLLSPHAPPRSLIPIPAPPPSLFSHLVAWLCSAELSSLPTLHHPDSTQLPMPCMDAHAAVGCTAARLLHARMVAGELHAEQLEHQLCAALQQANAAAAMQAMPAGLEAQIPDGKAAGWPCQPQQQARDTPPLRAPAQMPLQQNHTHEPAAPPPLSLAPTPSLVDHPCLPPPVTTPPANDHPEEGHTSCAQPAPHQPALRAQGTAAAQRVLIWLCCSLFQLYASQSMRSQVWEPGGAARGGHQPDLSTPGCTQRASTLTTFMPMLTQLVQLSRTRSELSLLRHLRITVQQATFSGIGLDFLVS